MSAGRSMTPAEVTQTLNGLADLRDRGAITPEEYEAKKADLLRRLQLASLRRHAGEAGWPLDGGPFQAGVDDRAPNGSSGLPTGGNFKATLKFTVARPAGVRFGRLPLPLS